MNKLRKAILIIIFSFILGLLIFILLSKAVFAPTNINLSRLIKTINPSPPRISKEIIYENKEPDKDKPIILIFGGDVMLSRQVNDRMRRYQDYTWPFLKIAPLFQAADLAIINLESPFTISNDYFVPTGSFSFKADPQAIIGLTTAGIDLTVLANNHIMNQGRAGLTTTKELTEANNIKTIGAGINEIEAHQPAIFTINNKKFGFLAYAYPEDYSVATSDRPGIANLDQEKMIIDITDLRNKVDVVIVNMHSGVEYTYQPNQQQISFARKAVEAGADLVVGHHPHWPQSWELYQNKPIIYSLGNLVFDQMWSKETTIGLIARLTWNDNWQTLEFIPIKITDYGQATIIEDQTEKENLFKKIGVSKNGREQLNIPLPGLD